jgi:hypothetical protein
MKKKLKKVFYSLFFLVVAVVIFGWVVAYLPTTWKIQNKGITPGEAAILRQSYSGPHDEFTTTDG